METVRVEMEIPKDILFAMRPVRTQIDVIQKIKIALAIQLFREQGISLGKATELAEMSRVRFIELLKKYDIPAYEYTEKHYDQDQKAIAKYMELTK